MPPKMELNIKRVGLKMAGCSLESCPIAGLRRRQFDQKPKSKVSDKDRIEELTRDFKSQLKENNYLPALITILTAFVD